MISHKNLCSKNTRKQAKAGASPISYYCSSLVDRSTYNVFFLR